jgi:hypothetical protein
MKKIIILVLSVLFLGSCIKEITDTVDKISNTDGVIWNPTIAVPLIYSKLGLDELFNQLGDLEFIRIEADGGLTIVCADEYETKTAEEIINLPNQSFGETYTLTAAQRAALSTAGTVKINLNRTIGYVFNNYEIDKIWFKRGEFNLNLSTTLEHDVAIKITIPEGEKNGDTFAPSISAIYTSLPNTADSSINLNGVSIDFTKTSKTFSEMDVELELTITKKGSNVIKPLETIDYTVGLENQKFSKLTGYFDVIDFTNATGDSLNASFFANNKGGSFTIADPRIKFIFTNSIGIPINARMIQFDGKSQSNATVSLTGVPDPLPIPVLSLSQMGQSVKDSFELNKSTSNISDYINNRPAKNFYQINVQTGTGGSARHWVVDTSRLKARVELEVPLEGTARDYALEARQQFDLSLDNVTEIKEVLVRLYTENGFPVAVRTQLYFEDSTTNTVLDSLLGGDRLILPSGTTNSAGKVISPNPKTTDIVLHAARIDKIKNANRIRIRAEFNTPFDAGGTTQSDVKFLKEYALLLQFGVQAQVLIKSDL